MSKIFFTIDTWSCNSCGYIQDIDPTDDAEMVRHFGRAGDICPSCTLDRLTPEINKPMRVKVADPSKMQPMEIDEDDGSKRPETAEEFAERKGRVQAELAKLRVDKKFKEVK